MKFDPVISATGPDDAKLMIIGEAPGENEEAFGVPFIGHSGQELRRALRKAGIDPKDTYMTNVFWTRPPGNDVSLCFSKEITNQYKCPHGCILPELIPEMERLQAEIAKVKPNLILALGNTALWATTGQWKISAVRGTVIFAPPKVLSTYHPSAVLRDWSLHPIFIVDLLKAARQSAFPELRRPERFITLNPSYDEVDKWFNSTPAASFIACDIETRKRTITWIGFARSETESLTIPFVKKLPSGQYTSYWETPELEVKVRKLIDNFFRSGRPMIFHNCAYDLQYLLREGFRITGPVHDTMLMHHAHLPEMRKSLGFLGSVYTDEPAWKSMRERGEETFKLDDVE